MWLFAYLLVFYKSRTWNCFSFDLHNWQNNFRFTTWEHILPWSYCGIFWMVWTASSHFRVVLTSNDLILSSPCQENHKREMWTISDKKLNTFLAFLTLSWAELSRGFRLWSLQERHFTNMLAVPSRWQHHKLVIFVVAVVLSIISPFRTKKWTLPL